MLQVLGDSLIANVYLPGNHCPNNEEALQVDRGHTLSLSQHCSIVVGASLLHFH